MPRVCPPPPDCPLYDQRLDYGTDEPLRRAVLMERHSARPSLGDLVWTDFNRQYRRLEPAPPTRPALPRPAEPLPLPIPGHLKPKGAKP